MVNYVLNRLYRFERVQSQKLKKEEIGYVLYVCIVNFSFFYYYFSFFNVQTVSINRQHTRTRIHARRFVVYGNFFLAAQCIDTLRAEYVAPLGSSSLVFNFLFARFLVGTPVTSTDIYVRRTYPYLVM